MPPGREEELREVERLAAKGANTLIVGWEGYGKSLLLKHLSRNGLASKTPCDVLVYFTAPGPAKEFLVRLGLELHRLGDLQLELDGQGKHGPHWVLEKLKVRPLYELVHGSLAKSRNRFLFLIDDLDRITPGHQRMFQELLELRNVQVVATAKSQRPKLSGLWHHFFTVGLGRLPREVADRLVERFLEEHGIPVAEDGRRPGENLKLLKERLYRKSRGNPRNLQMLLRKLEIEGHVDREYLRTELGAEEDEPYIDMTWFIIATAAIIMAIRYLGLGLHDRELYILAGTGYAATILLRYMSYKWKR